MTARIGPYAIIERWAEGGMAEVFLVQRDGEQSLSVLKRLRAERESDDHSFKRLRREAQLATLLDHPNIARISNAAEDEETGSFYLVYELVSGETLAAFRERFNQRAETIPLDVIWAIALSALDALEHAHELKDAEGKHVDFVHRDITPSNLMIDHSGVVKLIDFGIARADVDSFKTRPGMLMGTVRYFSPEHVFGERVDRRADLYGLAVIVHELVTGRDLITGIELRDFLKQIVEERPPPVSRLRADCPVAVDAVLAKALAKRPDERFATARELSRALRAAIGIEPASRERLREVIEDFFGAEIIRANIRRGQAVARAPASGEAVVPTAFAAHPAPRPTVTHTIPPLPATRSPLTLPFGAAALLLSIAVLGGVLIRAVVKSDAPPPEESEILTFDEPRVAPRPEAVAKDEDPPPSSPPRDVEPRPEAVAKTPRKRLPDRKASEPQPKPQPEAHEPFNPYLSPPYGSIYTSLMKLQKEHDGTLFDQTAAAILEEAAKLPDRDRRAVTTWVDNAQRAQSTDELVKAFDKLIRARPAIAP